MPNHSLERTGDSLPSARDGKDLASEKRSRGSDPRPLPGLVRQDRQLAAGNRACSQLVLSYPGRTRGVVFVRRVVEEAKVL